MKDFFYEEIIAAQKFKRIYEHTHNNSIKFKQMHLTRHLMNDHLMKLINFSTMRLINILLFVIIIRCEKAN